ncbi:MAG: ribosome biogenesis GTPase YlqF [Clostridia bacterium]|nr:ribosome biogenesis GTPase YlqF [Clostridia bacterium]
MINWFPGHMNKTLKQMQELNKLCNCFVYVLDARSPKACLNPEFVKVIGDKPIVYVLNKSDKANEVATTKWKQHFNSLPNSRCVVTNATISKSCVVIVNAIMDLLKDKVAGNREKQVNFVFRAMVLGVPNSGKSTIVNNLCGKARAVTGDKAGVTKNVQWVTVNPTLQIMDTPGTLWPSFEDEDLAYQLAYIGSIKDDVLNIVEIAGKLAVKLLNIKSKFAENYKLSIERKFDIDNMQDCMSVLEMVARKRGCILKGNEIDYERVAKLILNDFRKGSLGKVTFSLPYAN